MLGELPWPMEGAGGAGAGAAPKPSVFRSVRMEMAHHRNSPGILSHGNNPSNAEELDEFMAMEQYAQFSGSTPDINRLSAVTML